MSKALVGFLNPKAAEGLSPRTLTNYEFCLKQWIEFAGDPRVERVTPQEIREYLVWLRTENRPRRYNGDRGPLSPKTVRNAFKPQATPRDDEPVARKAVNSAFIGTTLEARLRQHGIQKLVIVGLTTDHSVSTTARMAGNLGFEVVVDDATATFERVGPDQVRYSADQVHRLALTSLHGEFAQVQSTEEVLAWLGGSSAA